MGSLDGSSAQKEPTGIVSSFLRLAEAPNQAAFCWDAVRDVVWLSPGFSRIFSTASPHDEAPAALEAWLRSFVPSKDAAERALSGLRHLDGQGKFTVGVEMAGGRGPGSACVSGDATAGPDGGRVVLGTARLLLPGIDGLQQSTRLLAGADSGVSQQQQQQQQRDPPTSPRFGSSALMSNRGGLMSSFPCSSSPSRAEGSLSLGQWHQHMEGSGMTPNSVHGGRVGLQGHSKASSASLHYSLMGGSRDLSSQAAAAITLRQVPRRWSDTQVGGASSGGHSSLGPSLCLLRAAAEAQGINRQAPRRLSQTQAKDSPFPGAAAATAAAAAAGASVAAPLCIVIAVSKDAEGNTLQRTAAKVAKRMTKQEPRIVRAQGREAVAAAACDDGADIVLVDSADAAETMAAIRQRRQPPPGGTLPLLPLLLPVPPVVALLDSSYCRRAPAAEQQDNNDDDGEGEVSAHAAFDDAATKPLSAAVLTSLFGKHVPRLSKDRDSPQGSPRLPAPPVDFEAAATTIGGTAAAMTALRTSSSAPISTLAAAAAVAAAEFGSRIRASCAAGAGKASDAPASTSRAGDAAAASGSKVVANILIADDSAANQMALKRVVRKVGREVLGAEPNIRTAGDGSEALQAAQQTRFDLVFMDIHMPVMNGIEALQGIRERYTAAEMPVVAVSGTDEAAGPGLSSAGFNEVVFKPISTTQVKCIIQKFVTAAEATSASPPPADAAAAAAAATAAAAPVLAPVATTTQGVSRKRGRAEEDAAAAAAAAPEAASAGAAAELASSPKSARREDAGPPGHPSSSPSPTARSGVLPGAPPWSSAAAGGAQERQAQPQWPIFTVAAKNRPATPQPTSISATEAYAPVSYTPISELPVRRIQRAPSDTQASQCPTAPHQGPSLKLRRFRFLVVGASLETLSSLEEKIIDTVVQDLGGPQPLVESVVATDEALAATHSHQVDIVFVDLNRPTAGAVVAELRRAFNIASLPIVGLVTQRGDAKRTQEITSELISLKGLNEVDLKPVPTGRIKQIIIDNLRCCKHLKPQLRAAPALAPPPRNSNRITCLVAEDDQTAMRMAKRILEKANIEVMEARNGFEAVAAATGYLQGCLDIVLMDCNMPIKDGWQATRAIRAWEAEHNTPAVPIVAVTANVLEEARGSCLAAGMNEYLRKPVQRLLLLETITKMTGYDCSISCASSSAPLTAAAAAAASSAGATGTGTTTESELTTASRFLSAFGSSTTAATRGTASSKNSASDFVVLETERVSAVAPAGRSCGALLVDEDLERLLRNKAALEAAGVVVDTAEGGAQALLKLRAGDTAYAAVMVASDLALATGAEEIAIKASQGPHDPPRLVLLRETRPRPDLRTGANPAEQRRAPEEAAGLWFRILDLPMRRQGLHAVLADCGLPAPCLCPGGDQEQQQQLPPLSGSRGPSQQPRSLSELRILYVDDSKAMRDAVLWMLHAEGLVQAQAMGALELCNGQSLPLPDRSGSSGDSEKFSAVLLNAGDPETAALCAEALKVAQPGLPVVAVASSSSSSSSGSPSDGAVPGADKVVSRDCFGPAAVMEAIHEVVGAGPGTRSLLGDLKDNEGGDEDLRPPVADVGAALLEFEHDWDFVLSLLQCFLSNGYEQISGLVEASFSKPMNLVRLKHLAHMLSGAAASCRILSIAAVCQQLEKLAVERIQEVTDGRKSREQHILVLASTTQRLFLEVAEFYSWLKGLQSVNVESGLEHTGGTYAHFVKSLDGVARAATELLLHPDEQQTEQQNRAAVVCLLEESCPLVKAAAPPLSAAVESYKQQRSEHVWQELSRELRSLGEEVRGLVYNRPPARYRSGD